MTIAVRGQPSNLGTLDSIALSEIYSKDLRNLRLAHLFHLLAQHVGEVLNAIALAAERPQCLDRSA